MELTLIKTLLGRSLYDPIFKEGIFEKYNIAETIEIRDHFPYFSDDDLDFLLLFNSKSEYQVDTNGKYINPKDFELFQISFYSRYPHSLPFNVSFHKNFKEICTLLGKPLKYGINSNDKMFYKNGIVIVVRFSVELSSKISFMLPPDYIIKDKDEAKRLKLIRKKSVISAENLAKVLEMAQKMPVHKWRESRENHNNSLYPEPPVKATEEVLLACIEEIAAALPTQKENLVEKSLKKCVKSLNNINIKFNSFIETSEREDLAAFINKLAIESGLNIEQGEDLTWTYERDW